MLEVEEGGRDVDAGDDDVVPAADIEEDVEMKSCAWYRIDTMYQFTASVSG